MRGVATRATALESRERATSDLNCELSEIPALRCVVSLFFIYFFRAVPVARVACRGTGVRFVDRRCIDGAVHRATSRTWRAFRKIRIRSVLLARATVEGAVLHAEEHTRSRDERAARARIPKSGRQREGYKRTRTRIVTLTCCCAPRSPRRISGHWLQAPPDRGRCARGRSRAQAGCSTDNASRGTFSPSSSAVRHG